MDCLFCNSEMDFHMLYLMVIEELVINSCNTLYYINVNTNVSYVIYSHFALKSIICNLNSTFKKYILHIEWVWVWRWTLKSFAKNFRDYRSYYTSKTTRNKKNKVAQQRHLQLRSLKVQKGKSILKIYTFRFCMRRFFA